VRCHVHDGVYVGLIKDRRILTDNGVEAVRTYKGDAREIPEDDHKAPSRKDIIEMFGVHEVNLLFMVHIPSLRYAFLAFGAAEIY